MCAFHLVREERPRYTRFHLSRGGECIRSDKFLIVRIIKISSSQPTALLTKLANDEVPCDTVVQKMSRAAKKKNKFIR